MHFDATLKTLLEAGPADCPRLLGRPATDVQVIDADASTVTGAADKVLRVNGPDPYILHLEFQSSPDAAKPQKLNLYNAVLEDRTGLPVRTAFILLRPIAFLRAYDGQYRRALGHGMEPYRTFRYDVVRVWELPPERLLAGLGTLPLAPIGAVDEAGVPRVLREMKKRLGGRTPPSVAEQLMTSTYVLLGLRYEESFIERLFQEIMGMEESTTYQGLLRRGAVAEARKLLLRIGELQIGTRPSAAARQVIDRVETLPDLERLTEQALTADSWESLLGLPPARPRRRRP
jgi:predicted transposase YdaD